MCNKAGGDQTDLAKATELAIALHTQLGLGDFGPVWLGETRAAQLLATPVYARIRAHVEEAEAQALSILSTNRALLEQMQGIQDRRAALVSTLVALRSADDPEPLVATGRAPGLITQQPIGENGFGFDPVMYLPAFGKTFAELPTELKNANSHRGRAAQHMLALMRERWFAPAPETAP